MIVLYSSDHIAHAPKHEFYDGKKAPYAEKPGRIENIAKTCRSLSIEIRKINQPLDTALLTDIHQKSHITYLASKCAELAPDDEMIASNFIKDTYTRRLHQHIKRVYDQRILRQKEL